MKVFAPFMLLLTVYEYTFAFAPLPSQALHRHRSLHVTSSRLTKTRVGCRSTDEPTEEKPSQDSMPQRREKKGLTPIQKVFWFVSDVWGYTLIIVGNVLAIGLLLNFLGYGYSFDYERGFDIDKIERMREKQQFRAETMRPPLQLPK